eukprot:TRINITY_DN3867_c0_g1_i1.p1 TRINITY_DN3867_c0_g1~~TRINITY_DN3867_c0_g1_i1.p1  ORF type:complete len:342 (+),score=146.72 TRINITY_DN3867_c0_g1_i1:84-1028(+)
MDGVVLHTSPSLHNIPAMLPGCLAAEALLRMGHVEFKRAVDVTGVPVPRLKSAGKKEGARWATVQATLGQLLRDVVPQRHKLQQEEARLTSEQRVLKTAFAEVCEEYLHPVQLFILCGTPEAWAATQAELGKHVSAFRLAFLSNAVSALEARHKEWAGLTEDKALAKLRVACDALAGQLGEGQWILGTAWPTSLDAIVFGYLAVVLYPDTEAHAPFAEVLLREYPALVRYCELVRMKYFEVYSLSFFLRRGADFGSPRLHAPAKTSSASLWCRVQGCAVATFSLTFFTAVNYDFLKQVCEFFAEELANREEGVA